jgi:HPt (histidine-containing phosphotransfer) domain-containing protein
MIDLFLDYAGKKIAEARAAYLAGESAGVEQAVHPLKSSAGNVGAARMQALAQELEILAKQGQLGPLGGPLDQLEQAFLEVKPELEQKRKQHSSPPG